MTTRARKNRETALKLGEVPERDLAIGKACLGLAECLLYAKGYYNGSTVVEAETVLSEATEHLTASEASSKPFVAMAAKIQGIVATTKLAEVHVAKHSYDTAAEFFKKAEVKVTELTAAGGFEDEPVLFELFKNTKTSLAERQIVRIDKTKSTKQFKLPGKATVYYKLQYDTSWFNSSDYLLVMYITSVSEGQLLSYQQVFDLSGPGKEKTVEWNGSPENKIRSGQYRIDLICQSKKVPRTKIWSEVSTDGYVVTVVNKKTVVIDKERSTSVFVPGGDPVKVYYQFNYDTSESGRPGQYGLEFRVYDVIADDMSKPVYTRSLSFNAGASWQSLQWNGAGSDGKPLKPSKYELKIVYFYQDWAAGAQIVESEDAYKLGWLEINKEKTANYYIVSNQNQDNNFILVYSAYSAATLTPKFTVQSADNAIFYAKNIDSVQDGENLFSWNGKCNSLRGKSVENIITPGKYKIILSNERPNPNDEQNEKSEIEITVHNVNLKSVEFSTSDSNSIFKVRDDETTLLYEPPHWVDNSEPLNGIADPYNGDPLNSKDKNIPVCFIRNSDLNVSPIFQMNSAEIPSLSLFSIKGTGTEGYVFYTAECSINNNELTSIGSIVGNKTLPNSIYIYDDFVIEWKISLDDGKHEYSVGKTSTKIYVLLNKPILGDDIENTLLFNTTAYYSCKSAMGFTSHKDVMASFFALLYKCSRKIKKVNNSTEILTYYKSYNCGSSTTFDLLKTNDGNCIAWAKFFVDMYKIQGIKFVNNTSIIGFYRKPKYDLRPSFLVKKWIFNENGSSPYPDFPYINKFNDDFTADTNYVWSYSEVNQDRLSDENLAGQNQNCPPSLFSTHFVVLLEDSDNLERTMLFDPSYGVIYKTYHDFEEKFIDGYVDFPEPSPEHSNERICYIKRREGNESEFLVFSWYLPY